MRTLSGPLHVLHVDDEPDFSELLTAFFEREIDDITVETATSAREALDHVADNEVDCIVSDYDMPGCNGIELLRTVREEYPDLPFILFTGKGSEEVAAEAVEADVSGYLQKNGLDTLELLANRVRNEVADYRIASSYREYKTVVDSLTDPVYVLDREGRFSDVNDAFLELTGYDEAAVIGSDPTLVMTPKSVERTEEHLERILAEDGPDDALFEVEVRTADDRTIRCEAHVGAIPSAEGFRGSVGVLRDVSDRVRSEGFRRQLYELASTTDLGFEEACRRMLRLGCERLGVEEGKLVRIDADAGAHETVVAARDTAQEGTVADLSKTYCRRVVEVGGSVAFHDAEEAGWGDDPAAEAYGHACYAGTEVTAEGEQFGTVCFFGSEPRPVSFDDAELTFIELVGRIIGQRIERRRSRESLRHRERTLRRIHDVVSDRERTHEERVRALLDLGRETLGTDYAVVSHIRGDRFEVEVLSAAGREINEGDVLPASKAACERTVVERETRAAARLDEDPEYAEHPIHTELGFECYVGTPIYQGESVYGTLCFLDRSGRDRPFSEWETTLVELMSQWVSYSVEERASREALARERDRLEEFAGAVSHDLRGPLSVAGGQLELASIACECGETADAHAAVRRALDRMDALIEDTLALARQGRSVGETEATALADVAEARWEATAHGRATLRTEGALPTVEADPDRLDRLLGNLFRNSLEHAGEEVTVEIGRIEGPGPADGFYVADDGPGIPPAEREDVFEQGYSTEPDNTGFGLSIVRRIAEAHGWEVAVTESAAGGARFEITGIEFVE